MGDTQIGCTQSVIRLYLFSATKQQTNKTRAQHNHFHFKCDNEQRRKKRTKKK